MSSKRPAKPQPDREDRLKAALKANMARRKAQARARGDQPGPRQAEQSGAVTKEDE
ncbi:MAG: hypothetical protein R3D85_14165 [Paracoccaceae bacterium]